MNASRKSFSDRCSKFVGFATALILITSSVTCVAEDGAKTVTKPPLEKIMVYFTNINNDSNLAKIDDNDSLRAINTLLANGWSVKSITSSAAPYATNKSGGGIPTAAAFLTVVALVKNPQ